MLDRAPYQVPSREDEERSEKAQGGPHTGGMPCTASREIGTPVSEDEREGGTDIPTPHGKKRNASKDLEVEGSKRGKKSPSRGSGSGGDIATQCPHRDRPQTES